MSKRFGRDFHNDKSFVSKKPRLDITKSSDMPTARRSSKSRTSTDDAWGDDFDQADLEEIDMIASQACSQEVNLSIPYLNPQPGPSNVNKNFLLSKALSASTLALPNAPISDCNKKDIKTLQQNINSQPKVSTLDNFSTNYILNKRNPPPGSQILASSNNLRVIAEEEPALDDFKKNLIIEKNLNSTFHTTNNILSQTNETTLKRRHEQLEEDYKKLLEDFTSKEGETIYLRKQLHQTQTKSSKESMEKTKLMEQQAGEFHEKINDLHKETESLKVQYELQKLQLNKYVERCKTLESNMIKLNSPTTNASLSNLSRSRSTPHKPNASIQAELINQSSCYLNPNAINYPFRHIPPSIFELSLPDKPIVDVQVADRSGKRNLPILQDEQSFRIFENPSIVKPTVTIVDNKNLCVKFIQPDIAQLINVSADRINSHQTILIINKIVAVVRELLLNILIVLEAIKQAMNNDDLRDMNDIYFSNFYDTEIHDNQLLFDSNEWHNKERGIEARRVVGVLSYIVKKSNYLAEYITGISGLNTQNDRMYEEIIGKMTRYNAWSYKRHKYEMLEIIHKFVTTANTVRRAHQFTGLICGICDLLKNVQKTIGFNNDGFKYVSNIFKELVFSRPLLRCSISMAEMMVEFSECDIFINYLVLDESKHSLRVWKNILNFTEDACILKIFVNHLKRFKFDDITTIKMTYALMTFTDSGFRSDILTWPSESNNEYNARIDLLTLVIKMLHKCTMINLNLIEDKFISKKIKTRNVNNCNNNKGNDKKFYNLDWYELKKKQMNCVKLGVRFLSYLAKRDPEFLIRSIDIETPFFLFIENVTSICNQQWHEVDRESLMFIMSTFGDLINCDKPTTANYPLESTPDLFNTKSFFTEKSLPALGERLESSEFNDEQRMTDMFASLLQI